MQVAEGRFTVASIVVEYVFGLDFISKSSRFVPLHVVFLGGLVGSEFKLGYIERTRIENN